MNGQFIYANTPPPASDKVQPIPVGPANRFIQASEWNSLAGQMGDIQYWARNNDYNVRFYGAHGDGTTDDLPAFNAAIAAMSSAGASTGYRLLVPPATYFLNGTLHVSRQLVLQGYSGAGPNGSSVLLFPDGVVGIQVDRATTSPDGGAGDWSVIRDVTLQAQGHTSSSAHGIFLKARAKIENCNVQGFGGDGIHIVADSGSTPSTNANNWRISYCRVASNYGNGIYVQGGDSNAGMADSVDVSSNALWGVYDSSFLGNTYVGMHAAANGSGPYKSDEVNARNLFLGCYSEAGQPPSSIVKPATSIGGLHAAGFATGSAPLLLDDTWYNSPAFAADLTGSSFVYVGNGNPAQGAQYFAFTASGENNTSYFRYGEYADGFNNFYEWNFADLFGVSFFKIAGSASVISALPYHVYPTFPLMKSGAYFGSSRFVIASAAPSATGIAPTFDTWNSGDFVLNSSSAAGAPLGWRCTSSGTLGTYSSYESLTATANGTTTVTLSGATSYLAVGILLTINGVSSRVTGVSGATLTMSSAIPSGSGLAVTFTQPVFTALYTANGGGAAAKTSNYAMTAGDLGTTFSNAGATGSVTITLPACTPGTRAGPFMVEANQNLQVLASGGATISTVGGSSSTNGHVDSSTQYSSISLRANPAGTSWVAETIVGTWSLT